MSTNYSSYEEKVMDSIKNAKTEIELLRIIAELMAKDYFNPI